MLECLTLVKNKPEWCFVSFSRFSNPVEIVRVLLLCSKLSSQLKLMPPGVAHGIPVFM